MRPIFDVLSIARWRRRRAIRRARGDFIAAAYEHAEAVADYVVDPSVKHVEALRKHADTLESRGQTLRDVVSGRALPRRNALEVFTGIHIGILLVASLIGFGAAFYHGLNVTFAALGQGRFAEPSTWVAASLAVGCLAIVGIRVWDALHAQEGGRA